MTQSVVVRDSDQNLFLSKAIAHGVSYGKLTDERRAALVDEATNQNMLLCDELGLNRESHANVLETAKLFEKLLSIELEVASGGALDMAVAILAQQPLDKIIQRVKHRIFVVYKRIYNFRRQSQQHYDYFHPQAGIVSIKLAMARTLGEMAGYFNVPLDTIAVLWTMADLRDRKVRLAVLQEIDTRAKLLGLEALVKYADHELAASQKFLPWAELKKTAKLMVMHNLSVESQRIKNAVLAADEAVDDSESAWGVDTMVATIALNIIINGTRFSRLRQSVIQWNKLKGLSEKVFTDENLKREMLLAVDIYIPSLTPKPSPAEEEVLRTLWQGALKEFFALPITGATMLSDKITWASHVHLKSGSRIIYPGEMVWREAHVLDDDEDDMEYPTRSRKKRGRYPRSI